MPFNHLNRRRGRRKKVLLVPSTGRPARETEEVHFEDILYIVVYMQPTHYKSSGRGITVAPGARLVIRRRVGPNSVQLEHVHPLQIVSCRYGTANNIAKRLNAEYETDRFVVKRVAVKDFKIEEWNLQNTERQRRWWQRRRAKQRAALRAKLLRHRTWRLKKLRYDRDRARKLAIVTNMEKRLAARRAYHEEVALRPRVQPNVLALYVKVPDYPPMPKEFFRVIRRKKE